MLVTDKSINEVLKPNLMSSEMYLTFLIILGLVIDTLLHNPLCMLLTPHFKVFVLKSRR